MSVRTPTPVMPGLIPVTLTTRATTAAAGIGPWVDLRGTWSRFSLYSKMATGAASSYSVKLEGALSTRTTGPIAPKVLTPIATSANAGTFVVSTAQFPCRYVRYHTTKLPTGRGLTLIVAGVP